MIRDYETKAVTAVKTKARPLDRDMIEAMQEKKQKKPSNEIRIAKRWTEAKG